VTLYGAYRPAFVTQRDGSPLANSNCRMASIAMGLAYDASPQGSKTATAAKMRSYTDDQSGGTDSGDASQAWSRGYGESLRVMDGHTFADAIQDLKAGRAVHLDVWHGAVGGPCLSGSGAYGHTIIVLPDHDDRGWAVGDPWCSPSAGYARVLQGDLAAGAEYWGGQVYSAARAEPDYPTGGQPRDPAVLVIVSRIVKRLMDRYRPGAEWSDAPDPGDTGGGAILYTTTRAVPGTDSGGSEMGTKVEAITPESGTARLDADGPVWRVVDDQEVTAHAGTEWVVIGRCTYHVTAADPDGAGGYMIVANAADRELHVVARSRVTFTPDPVPPPSGDCADDIADALAARDAEWIDGLTASWPDGITLPAD